MSINYSVPSHRVDIPVTDLDDDSDDEILFHQQNQAQLGSSSEDNIDDLDFEADKHHGGFIDKVKGFFNNNDRYDHIESYELHDTTNINDFNISDDEDTAYESTGPEPKWKSTIKHRNFKGAVSVISILAVVLVFQLLLPHGSVDSAGIHTSKILLSNSTHNFHPTTIVISLDGFHPHYISPKITPTLHEMMMNEFGAPYMIPSFPSSTFPNHWTLITGLYPSEHGIVGNTFYDPQLNKQFVNTNPKIGGLDPDFWQGGEPVWETAFKQGVSSAVHMWPGSEVPGIGISNGPIEVDRYNGSELLSSKVDRVFKWIDSELGDRPELILTYVPTIDSYGHQFGISGPNLTHALTYVDDFINLMRKQISARNLTDIVNLVIVSDHGMAPTSNDRLLYLDELIDLKKIEHIDGWPLFGLRPFKDYSIDDIYDELMKNFNASDKSVTENFQIYRVEDMPKEWDFGGNLTDHKFNYRLAPIWVVPKVGYAVTTHQQMKEKNNDYTPKGVHGYNNTELLMRATFLATGPYFRSLLGESNKRIKPFRNTEVYNLICHSLNLTPAPNNGTMKDGYIVPIVSPQNQLPQDWTDSLVYPGLDYEVAHIVEDATYDLMWKPKDKDAGFKTVYMSSNPNPAESLTSEESSLIVNPDVSLPKPSDFSGEGSRPTKKPEAKQSDAPKHGFFGGIWDKIDHLGEEIEDAFDDIGDNFEDASEDLADSVKDGWEDLTGFLNDEKNDDRK